MVFRLFSIRKDIHDSNKERKMCASERETQPSVDIFKKIYYYCMIRVMGSCLYVNVARFQSETKQKQEGKQPKRKMRAV